MQYLSWLFCWPEQCLSMERVIFATYITAAEVMQCGAVKYSKNLKY